MSGKAVPTDIYENRNLGKQIGCMNGIFQLFDRHNFLTGWRTSSHSHKRILGAQHQLEPHNATKAATDKDMEVQKQKPRASTESSQASNSSSSCSSTFSSLDHSKTAKPETHSLKQTNTSKSPFQIKPKKEQLTLTNGQQSPDIRHVVKDSMYREARGVSIKSFTTDERKVTVMKHIDSPRLLQHSKLGKPKPMVNESKKDSRDERLTLHRFSYDGRESGDAFKTTLKLKEQLPRLSLDSKASSMKCSALDSRLNFLPLNQEPGNHTRSSSIVAKLMGLDDIPVPDTITTGESKTTNMKSSPSPSPRVASLSKSSTTTEENKEKRTSFSSPPRLHNANSVTKPTTSSRLPMEPAPWKQRDSLQGSPKMEAQSRKSPTSTPILPTSSVYAEMEKRITEIQFKRSGKDLRALKQILEAMQKTRERLENQRGQSAELPKQKRCSLEDSCSTQDSPMWQNRKTYQQFVIIKETCPPKQLRSSTRITKSAKVTEKVKFSSSGKVSTVEKRHAQGVQTQDPKYHRDEPASREKPKDFRPRNNDMKEPSRPVSSTDKKTTWRNLEQERNLRTPPRMRIENCSTSGRGFEMVSPRLQQNVLGIEGESHPTIPSSESGRKKHSSRKARENCSQYRKNKVKSMDFQLSEDQLSELSSEPRYSSYQGETASVKSESNNSVASHLETEVISLVSSTNPNSRKQQNSVSTSKKHMPAVELGITMTEQPSPVSVLDTTFYTEDSPSPIKKISTAFQDESPGPDEAEWLLENLNMPLDPGYKYNPKSQDMLHLVQEIRLLKTEPSETAVNHNESVYRGLIPDHRYINKILAASGLLRETCIIPTADQLLSSHLINPDIFHVLEEMEEENGQLTGKNDGMKLSQKMQRRIIFDTVNEMLVQKITSVGLFTLGRKRMSPQGLMRELYLEMDHLCGMPYCTLDDEDDRSIRLITADMKYESDDWTDYSSEVPTLVLEIERLIFKDLINEVVTGQVEGLHDSPKKHCRQLFTK